MIPKFLMIRDCALAAFLWSATATFAAAGSDAALRPAEIYLRVCSSCHGEKGNGKSLATGALKTSPRDFTTEEARTNLSREYMIAIVRDGRPHSAMVGRTTRLSLAEIEATVDFIRSAFMLPEPGTQLARGSAIYRKSCAVCHGDRGQGIAGRAGNLAGPPLAAARVQAGFSRDRFVAALTRRPHATGSPAAGVELTPEDAQDVAAYVQSAFIEVAAGKRDTGNRKSR